MKYLFIVLLFSCSVQHPPGPIVIKPDPENIPTTPPVKQPRDTIHVVFYDSAHVLSIKDFGAVGDGIHDDADAVQAACDYVILHPQTLVVPIGNFLISRPILLQNPVAGRFFTLHLRGILSNKSSSNEYLSRFTYTGRSGYCFGLQLARSVEIENISILGQFTFPHSVTNANIGTLKFSDWQQPGITDSRYSPYCGISIDPNTNASGSAGGSSDVTIRNCAIKQFMAGIALSSNGSTLNDEIINIIDDDIEACRVAIAIGQDQSKTITIKGLKVWGSVATILDGVTYGRGTGGGSVFCSDWNIAGNCANLFNINTDRFPLSCIQLYAESLFRIGNVGSGAGANFINCQIDFLTGRGMPAADYLIAGQANFYGGCLRYYDNSGNHRMNLQSFGGTFRDMTLNTEPIQIGLYGAGPSPTLGAFPRPVFDNVYLYYRGKKLVSSEAVVNFRPTENYKLDTVTWTATIGVPPGLPIYVGSYVIGSPGSHGRKAYDPYLNPSLLNTVQMGRVVAINGSTLTLDDVGLNATDGASYDAIFIDNVN